MITLFCNIPRGTLFHFYDNPERILIKSDKNHYVAPEGRHPIHPYVLVVQEKSEADGGTRLFNQNESENRFQM